MTVLLLSVGGAAAALGTRASAFVFIGAAVLGARSTSPVLAAVSTWTAVLLAAWALFDEGAVRKLAAPALGAAAVVAAAGAPNGAVVLGLWVLGTAVAVISRGSGASPDRWAALLCASDIVFAAVIASTAARGFEGWPFTIPAPGVAALIAAGALRASLAGGSIDESASGRPGLVIVRLQSVLLVGFAAAAATPSMLRALIVLAAVGFAAASLAPRRVSIDAAQELALAALAIASTRLGWLPSGWLWGTLAAGTLMHQLRFSLRSPSAGTFALLLRRSAGIGLPLLPVVGAQLEVAFRVHEWSSVVVLVGLLCGLAGRTAAADGAHDTEAQIAGVVSAIRGWLPLALAVAVAVWAPLISLPRPPGGDQTTWPPPWAVAVVVAGALLGTRVRTDVNRAQTQPATPIAWDGVSRRLRRSSVALDAVLTGRALWVLFCIVALAAAALWTAGLVRGFL